MKPPNAPFNPAHRISRQWFKISASVIFALALLQGRGWRKKQGAMPVAEPNQGAYFGSSYLIPVPSVFLQIRLVFDRLKKLSVDFIQIFTPVNLTAAISAERAQTTTDLDILLRCYAVNRWAVSVILCPHHIFHDDLKSPWITGTQSQCHLSFINPFAFALTKIWLVLQVLQDAARQMYFSGLPSLIFFLKVLHISQQDANSGETYKCSKSI